jgi:predicted dithiol-disulfide oxidoreductase (DUF899 family)
MATHSTERREEWQTVRAELARLEAERADCRQRVIEQRRALPCVPVDTAYKCDTEAGKKNLADADPLLAARRSTG